MISLIRRQWNSRLRYACAAAGRTRKVLEGREAVAKSVVREAKKTGQSLEGLYLQRLAAYQAEILIARAAIKAVDNAQGHSLGGNRPPVQTEPASRRKHPEPPGGIDDQRSLF